MGEGTRSDQVALVNGGTGGLGKAHG